MSNSASPVARFLQFLGKVKFTVILLLGGAVIMTVGTIVESRGSREVAWSAIYGTAWFDFFLFLIGVNLVGAVVNRLPIKRHQWPFVLTHVSIVLLLVGAWISHTFGYEGTMMIYEGGESRQIYLDSSEIRARWHSREDAAPARPSADGVVEAAFPLPRGLRKGGRELQEEAEGRPGLRIAEYVRDGVASVELADGGPEGNPGIRFVVRGRQALVHHWLIAETPRFARKDIGPLEVEFLIARSEGFFEARPAGDSASVATLLVPRSDGGDPVRITLPSDTGKEISIAPGLVARVEKFLLRARMVNGALTEVADGELNPAAVVKIESPDRTEEHIVFRNFPDFGMVRGREKGRPLVGTLRLVGSSGHSKPVAAIILGPADQLHLQLSTPAGRREAVPLAPGRPAALGELGLELEVERLVRRAKPEISVRPSPRGGDGGKPYVRVEATLSGRSASFWLAHGSSSSLSLDGHQLEVAFARQTRPVPFAIALNEFQLIRYPGSTRPAEYRSLVVVKPLSGKPATREAVISMNRPLDLAGFRLFQSSYRLGEGGEPDATFLSVSRDPGVPIVYVSFGLIILGIAWYLRGQAPKRDASITASAAAAGRPDPTRPAPESEAAT